MTGSGDELPAGEGVDDLAEFGEVAEILRRGPSDVVDESPSAALWNRIEAEMSAPTPGHSSRNDSLLGDQLEAGEERPATVTSLTERRSRRPASMAVIVGIAAALLLVALPLGLAYRASSSSSPLVADLAALNNFDGGGSAELDGRELRVETMGLVASDDSAYELWLLDLEDGEVSDLVSLGTIDADGNWEIDESIDVDEFSVVDISVEPNDGNPEHSGDSILRGDLTAAS